MVGVNPRARSDPSASATSKSARLARLARIRQTMEVPRVRVEPANDDMRRLLKHPNGMAFRSSGSVEWPLDRFTKRRLADKSIRLADKGEDKPAAKSAETKPAVKPADNETSQRHHRPKGETA